MAERRMFAKTIIDSDSFLDMPLSAQCLYFHLSMRADDDGFINNPKKIQRMISANDDDTKLLIAKSFIIPFDTGVVVIKHWRLHNYIQSDRYKPTMYQDEKGQLTVEKNVYQLMDTSCIQDGYNLDTQDRIGKDRIGKVNLSSVSDETLSDFPSEKSSPAPYDKIRDLYNSICKSYPKCTRLSAGRKKAIHARLKSGYTVEDFEKVFQMAEQSRFLKGGNDRNWRADFDWLIKDANMAKVLDGKYQDRQGGQNNYGCAAGAGTVAGPAESKKAYGGILILPSGEIIDETGGSEPVGKDPLYDPDEDW